MKTYDFLDFYGVKSETLELKLSRRVPAKSSSGRYADDWVPYYHFKIYESEALIGSINYRLSMEERIIQYYGHIAYEILPEFRGRRMAAKACQLLLPFIRQHAMPTTIITCHPNNIASLKTIEALGGIFLDCVSFSPSEYEPNRKDTNNKKMRYQIA